jgi:amino acid permease
MTTELYVLTEDAKKVLWTVGPICYLIGFVMGGAVVYLMR